MLHLYFFLKLAFPKLYHADNLFFQALITGSYSRSDKINTPGKNEAKRAVLFLIHSVVSDSLRPHGL